jgi:hypothetical protein
VFLSIKKEYRYCMTGRYDRGFFAPVDELPCDDNYVTVPSSLLRDAHGVSDVKPL